MDNLNDFLKENTRDGGFLQSEHWEKFQKKINRKKFRVYELGEFNALVLDYELPMVGSYFFIPRGPIMKISNSKPASPAGGLQITNECLNELIKNAKKNKVGWIRVEPQKDEDLEIIKTSLKDRFQIAKSKKNHEPAQTLMIDLMKSEEEILKEMKSKTRYNIRISGRRGVKIFRSRDLKYFEEFYELSQETAERDRIAIHSREYYEKMLESISKEALDFFYAEYQGEIVGAIMVTFFGGVATYLHGASSNKFRNVMANYGLQWEAIKEAKKRGCEKYDFGGVRVNDNEKNSWAGITKFKTGFCPNNKPINFPGCWDIILDKKKYWLYRKMQFMKGILRG
jgi:lipid II:glycine glycyltransferase (peptidoglycan interpeptide bridge formation enzyme)